MFHSLRVGCIDGPHGQFGHFGEEEISCPCQETNCYSSAVQPVAHSLHRISYPALCIIVYVWQAEHITLQQPISQLSSSHSDQLDPMKMNGAHPVGVLTSCRPHRTLKFKKNTVFVDMMLSNVLRDLPFS